MRRFGRRRRGGAAGEGRAAPIDAERWLGRIQEEGIVAVEGLAPVDDTAVPGHVAAVGRGTKSGGGDVLVAFAPRHAGDALLGALAAGIEAARAGSAPEGETEGGEAAADETPSAPAFSGEVFALAPQWSGAARRRLALVRAELPFTLTAVADVIVGAVFSTTSVTVTVMSWVSVNPPASVNVTCSRYSLSPLASPGASKSGAASNVTIPLPGSIENNPASTPPVSE